MSQNSTCTYFLGCLFGGFLRDYLNAGDSLASDEYESFFLKRLGFVALMIALIPGLQAADWPLFRGIGG